MKNIGLIGSGTMGEPMGESLLRAGFFLRLSVHRNRKPVERLVELGANEEATPAAVASASDLVITMVPDAPQVEEVLFGSSGAASAMQPGGTVIDMSTISPVASRSFHERLAAKGIQMLDAPVSGGPARAKTGELTIMVGGDAHVFERCKRVLEAMGKPTHVGPAGMGETFKLVNQIIISCIMVADVEGLVFAKKAGADITLLREVLGMATASNYLLNTWLPKAWFADHHQGGFALDLLRKDLRAALETAKAIGAPLTSTSLAYELYSSAAESGHGADDYSAVAQVYEKAAGTTVAQ